MNKLKIILMQPVVWLAKIAIGLSELDQFVFENRMVEYERKKNSGK